MDARVSPSLSAARPSREIADGTAQRPRGDAWWPPAVSAWLRALPYLYGERVLPFDSATARLLAFLSDLARGIAAILPALPTLPLQMARRHGFTILTRKCAHICLMIIPVIEIRSRSCRRGMVGRNK